MMPEQNLSRVGIGASQVAAIAGLNRWAQPIDVWREMVGEASFEGNEATRWGLLLEPAVRQAYVDDTGLSVMVPPESMFHGVAQHHRATPDGIVVDAEGRWQWGLEIKTSSQHLADEWGPAGTDEVPIHYAAQCAWSMHVTGLRRWDLAALIGGRDFRIYRLEWDADFAAALAEVADEFWHGHVVPKVPPAPDASASYREYLVSKWQVTSGSYLAATVEDEYLASNLRRLRAEAKVIAEQIDEFENDLLARIADHDGVETSIGKITCKPQRGRRLVDWQAIARKFGADVDPALFASLVEAHTKTGKPSRPLRYPPAWAKETK